MFDNKFSLSKYNLYKFIKMWILCSLIYTCFATIGLGSAVEQGDLKISVVSLAYCELPEESYDQQEKLNFFMSAYKVDRRTTRIRANFTVERKVGPITTHLRNYEIVDGRMNKVAEFDNISCDHIFVSVIAKMLHANLTDDCYLLPSHYSFDDFDVEKLSSFMILVWRKGRYAFDLEFRTPRGAIACVHPVLDIANVRAIVKSPGKPTWKTY